MKSLIPPPLYVDETDNLFEAADVTAEYLSTRVGLDQDLAVLLSFCGKVQPAFHRLTPARHRNIKTRAWLCLKTEPIQLVAFTVPLQVQAHQLVDVKAETNIRDGTAGVGLAAETKLFRNKGLLFNQVHVSK